jgi:hypothetical protein
LIVMTIFDQITAALARGERIELRGVRRLHDEAAQRPHRGQFAYWRAGVRGGEDEAVLQGRQRTARPAQSRWDEAEPRCHNCASAGRRGPEHYRTRRSRGDRFTGRNGDGLQPAMVLAHSRACA